MLPTRNRLRRSEDFTDAVRRGARGGARRVVVHVAGSGPSAPASDRDENPVLVGFVVPRAVGDAVSRNRVKRRLRHVMRDRVSQLWPGTRIVVRALPAASRATSAELARDVDVALHKAQRRGARSSVNR
ncbi:ribonuclease P protein component [Georgenia deserti]|uniref:Ribonuclease P protein component n=1 Tax=Georgenia deserti TaxID=2093781 RepID=A0ABW4L7P9_9MICO